MVRVLYTFCLCTMWAIWWLAVKNQTDPIRVVFGGHLNINVSSFLYGKSGSYSLAICVLLTALPVLAMILAIAMKLWRQYQATSDGPQGDQWALYRAAFHAICLPLMVVQYVVLIYIRGQAIHDASVILFMNVQMSVMKMTCRMRVCVGAAAGACFARTGLHLQAKLACMVHFSNGTMKRPRATAATASRGSSALS